MITLSGESIRKTDPYRHKYTDAMTEYLSFLGPSYDFSGDIECPTGSFALFGRRILFSNNYGFRWTETYPSEQSATQMFESLDLYYCRWLKDEDEDEDDTSLSDLDRFLFYVYSCASEDLDAYSLEDWKVRGHPRTWCDTSDRA